MQNKTKWPRVSFILLTFNGGDGVKKCLESVRKLDYPKKLIDVVVVDNNSKDQSVQIAKKFGWRVYLRPKGNLYSNWIYGLHKVKGELFFYLEQDIVLRNKNFIKDMIKPLLDDDRLVATFTKEYPKKDMHWACRYLSYHYSQCDPLLEYLFLPVEKSFVEKKKDYIVCKFEDKKIPPAARMFYRMKYLKKTPNWTTKNYFDHDFLINCVRSGYPYFGYVPQAGYYHYHVKNFKHLLFKRTRNLGMHFFPEYGKYHYKILDTKNKFEVLRLVLFVIYANLFFPALIRGFIRFIKHKDPVLLIEPIVVIFVTDLLLFSFIKDKQGKKILFDSIRSFFK
jgi:glycosyltransferase involved in cell wall biosynthesis